jgi:hypothetical protein
MVLKNIGIEQVAVITENISVGLLYVDIGLFGLKKETGGWN